MRKLLHCGPEEPQQLSGDSDDRDLWRFSISEMLVAFVKPLLGLPCDTSDSSWLSLLASFYLGTHSRPVAIAPRCLNEDMTTVAVASLSDRPSTLT